MATLPLSSGKRIILGFIKFWVKFFKLGGFINRTMKNRAVGIIVIGIAILMGFIIYLFNRALTEIVNTSCTHGSSCPMWGSINFQTNVGLGIMLFVVIIGLYLIFSEKFQKKEKREEAKEPVQAEDYSQILSDLLPEEKTVLEKVIEANGTIFQSDLVEKTGFTKVKVTRILDKLEGRGLIERKRRGMTNVVILKR